MPGRKKGENYQPSLDKLIPLRKAAELSGLSTSHLSHLIREGELWGTKMSGRNWFTTEEAVREYLARDVKPGPKSNNPAQHIRH